MKQPIDLEQLKRAAESGDGDRAIVERSWLAQALAEITAGRQAAAELEQLRAGQGRTFGLKPDQRL